MKKTFVKLLSVALAITASVQAMANAVSPSTQLKNFISNVKTASGKFTQEKVLRGWGAAEGDVISQGEKQDGEFIFERPGKFSWIVKKPSEQQIVSNGKTLLQYDPDLEQLTERDVKQAIGASPASILFGNSKLEDTFKLEVIADKDGWLRATPKQPDSGMKFLEIHLENNFPTDLMILDSFDKWTSIKFYDFKTQNPKGQEAFKIDNLPNNVTRVRL